MKNDKYLRFILTVIAICLVWICVRDIAIGPSNLFAGNNGRSGGVRVDGEELDVRIVGVSPTAFMYYDPFEVRITDQPIEVEIASPDVKKPAN